LSRSYDHDTQAALIDAMRRPAFYPHDTAPQIRLVQTHLSYVLLTGPFAYKINKAVDLGFADYSTLEKRRHFCNEEIRLNRLYAPDLYVDVVPIHEGANGFSLEANESEPLEYAVKMRQFRDQDLLLHVFERGELTRDAVEFIARRIAQFHENAVTDAEIAVYGKPEAVAGVVYDNLDSIAQSVGSRWPKDQFDRLFRNSLNQLNRYRVLLAQRAAHGFVRECHGDLHLGNICYFEGQIEFFDRIVFNDAFKNIDVMYDLAFLYMDLEYRGRADFANRLLNVYLEETNDFEGVRLLRFYAGCRAQIRAKVLAIEADEKEIPDAERPEMNREAKAYFDLAFQYAEETPPAPVTIMCGVAGSGKSTVAREYAMRSGAVCLRSDAVRKLLAKPGDKPYTDEMTERTYAFLIDEGLTLAKAGFPAVLDATFLQRDWRMRAIEACRSHNLSVRIFHCNADLDTLKTRVKTRVGDKSDANVSVLEMQLDAFEPFGEVERAHVTELDTTKPVDYSQYT
jgi:uncharacterized protein